MVPYFRTSDSVNLHGLIEWITIFEIFFENNKKQMTILCHTVEPAVCWSDRMLVFSSVRVSLSLRVSSCKACEKNERITKTKRYGYDLVKSKQNSVVYLGQHFEVKEF